MEAGLGTEVNPLEIVQEKEKIKELRKVRNKLKRQKQRAEKLCNPKPPVSVEMSTHLAIVSEQFAQQYARNGSDIDTFSTMKRGSKPQHSAYTLADVLNAERASKPLRINSQKHVNESQIVANILDKSQPIVSRGKHSERIRPKRLSKLKKEINDCQNGKDRKISPFARTKYNYSTNIITDALEERSTSFIADLVYLQEKYFKRDSTKAQIRKRYIAGFHQLKKYIVMKKLKLILIASDIKTSPMEPLDILISSIKQLAETNEIPFVFVLSRRQIGRLLMKQVPVSCLGVLNYDGVNVKYRELLEEVTTCKLEYLRTCNINAFPDADSSCNTLLELLKSQLSLTTE